jgi:hypothetical protein
MQQVQQQGNGFAFSKFSSFPFANKETSASVANDTIRMPQTRMSSSIHSVDQSRDPRLIARHNAKTGIDPQRQEASRGEVFLASLADREVVLDIQASDATQALEHVSCAYSGIVGPFGSIPQAVKRKAGPLSFDTRPPSIDVVAEERDVPEGGIASAACQPVLNELGDRVVQAGTAPEDQLLCDDRMLRLEVENGHLKRALEQARIDMAARDAHIAELTGHDGTARTKRLRIGLILRGDYQTGE